MVIVIVGSLAIGMGFTFYGPFADKAEAEERVASSCLAGLPFEVVSLVGPEVSF